MMIGKKIKALRERKGISAEVLALMIGVSPSTIYRYENSEISNIGINKLTSICTVLDVPVYYLLDQRKSASPSSKEGTKR